MTDKLYSELNEEDFRLLSQIKLAIYRALMGEIIPSMRAIFITWMPDDSVVTIYFYHDGKITEEIQSHYSSIMTGVSAGRWEYKGKTIECDYENIQWDYPRVLPKNKYSVVAYLRKEPFVDPGILNKTSA